MIKSGYAVNMAGTGVAVTLAAATCNAVADAYPGYFAEAAPSAVGSTGQRSFATDTRGTLFQDNTGAAIANPIVASAQVKPVQ